MLFTQLSELTALYPNQRWEEREFPQLLAYLEEEEETTLIPILGDTLYDKIVEDYNSLKDIIVPQTYDDKPDDVIKNKLRIVRACQRIIFFRMLANNSGIFAVSFNHGGGLNMLSADNYEPADDKTKRTFERDVWNKSKRNIETLLLNLERDAREQRIYTEDWKQSPYFYYHGDLLFTTAEEMKLFYPALTDREQFINLIPTIRIKQNAFIIPRLGEKAVQALISKKYNPSPAPVPDAPDSTPDGSSSPMGEGRERAWQSLRTYTLTALAQYILSDTNSDTHILSAADLSLSQAAKILSDNRYDLFPEERPSEDTDVPGGSSTGHKHQHKHHHHECPCHDAILDLGSINYD